MRKLGSDGLKVHLLTITKFEHTQILTVVFGRHALYLINVSIVIASSTVPGVPHQVLIWEHNICRWISLVLTPCRRFLPKEQFQKRVGSAVISSITTTGKLLTPSLISKGKSRCLAWKIIYVISCSQSLTPAFFLIQEKPLFFFLCSRKWRNYRDTNVISRRKTFIDMMLVILFLFLLFLTKLTTAY